MRGSEAQGLEQRQLLDGEQILKKLRGQELGQIFVGLG